MSRNDPPKFLSGERCVTSRKTAAKETNHIFDLLNFQYFPRFMVEASNVVDGIKPARTLVASLCVIILAATELIDLVGLSYN